MVNVGFVTERVGYLGSLIAQDISAHLVAEVVNANSVMGQVKDSHYEESFYRKHRSIDCPCFVNGGFRYSFHFPEAESVKCNITFNY